LERRKEEPLVDIWPSTNNGSLNKTKKREKRGGKGMVTSMKGGREGMSIERDGSSFDQKNGDRYSSREERKKGKEGQRCLCPFLARKGGKGT